MYRRFCKDYPIITIEDPFDQDDWDSTTKLTTEGVCQARCLTYPQLHLVCTYPVASVEWLHPPCRLHCICDALCRWQASCMC